jgi:signal transduction histidine kinase
MTEATSPDANDGTLEDAKAGAEKSQPATDLSNIVAPATPRDWLLAHLDGVSLGISLGGTVTIAAAMVLLIRITGGLNTDDLSVVVMALMLLAAAALIAHFVVVAVTRQRHHERLAAMREAAREMGHGDLSAAVPEGGDDLGMVGRSLNAMAQRMGRLLQAQRDLLSGVSHELRSPIARIEVALELISLQSGEDPDRQELIEGIREETALLERHISRLLEAQRVSTKRVLLKRKALVLDELVRKVMDRERRRLDKLGWNVETALALGNTEVIGDENALDRVLSTLVENAIQHATPPPGSLHAPSLLIETRSDADGGAIVKVSDRGPGLTQEQCERAFAPFFRIDQSRSTKTGGTGLGMYLARKIAEAHHGRASAHPREGGGLVVQMTIPLRGKKELKETLRVEISADTLAKIAKNVSAEDC